MVFSNWISFLLVTNIPLYCSTSCLISSKTITGFFLARLSNITWGCPSVKEGNIKISCSSYCLIKSFLLDIGFKNVYNLGGLQEWVEAGGEMQANI